MAFHSRVISVPFFLHMLVINFIFLSNGLCFDSQAKQSSDFCIVPLVIGLPTDSSPVQGVLQTLYTIKKLKSGEGPTKGCRAIDG
jgi:hypothetical protein